MKITRVCCQGCGADLQVDESVRFATCNYCHAKLEIVHDPSVTHTRLMEKIEQNTDRMAGNLRVIELQNDLERLDREWETRKENFMVHGQNGHRYLPGSSASFVDGAIFCIGGIVALSFGFSPHRGGTFSMVALAVAAMLFYGAFSRFTKVSAYRAAAIRYERERHNLARRIDKARGG